MKAKRFKPKDWLNRTFHLSSFIFKSNSRGMSLVEILVAVAVFSLIASGMVGAIVYGREGSSISGARARAAAVAKEGVEAVRSIDYNALPAPGTYGLVSTGAGWSLSGASDTVDTIFVRTIVITVVDGQTKQAVVKVTYNQNAQRTNYAVTLTTRLTAWAWTWNNGVIAGTFDIPTALATSDGKKIKVLGDYAYVVRTNTTNDLRVIRVADNGLLRTPSAFADVGGRALASAANNLDVAVHSNGKTYVAVSEASGNPEVEMFDVTAPATIPAATAINPTGNTTANSVAFDGRYIYFGRISVLLGLRPEFYIYDFSNPAAPAAAGTVDYGAVGTTGINDLVVLTDVVSAGDCFVYLATTDTANEIQVVTCTNRAAPTLANLVNLSTAASAQSINAYKISATDIRIQSGSGNNFFATQLSAPTTVSATSAAFDFGMPITDISKDSMHNYAFVVGGASTSNQFKVFNIATIANAGALPAALNVLTYSAVSNTLNGVTYNAALDRAFAVGTVDTQEIMVASPR